MGLPWGKTGWLVTSLSVGYYSNAYCCTPIPIRSKTSLCLGVRHCQGGQVRNKTTVKIRVPIRILVFGSIDPLIRPAMPGSNAHKPLLPLAIRLTDAHSRVNQVFNPQLKAAWLPWVGHLSFPGHLRGTNPGVVTPSESYRKQTGPSRKPNMVE